MADEYVTHAREHMLALPHMDPPGERVLIPYGDTQLAAILRKPRNVEGRPPVVLMTMGLDSTKEELMTFESTFLSHSANNVQAHERAKLLTLEGIANRIECPLFVIAGGLDRLCPPGDAKRLAAEAKGPVELLVIEDGTHVAHNRPYRYRPQSADWMAEQLGA